MRASPAAKRPLLHLGLLAILLAVAAAQARYGSPELFGDDISYLDIGKAIQAGDWHTALSPYWSIGYPLLLSSLRLLFPAGVHGLLLAAVCLNLIVFLASWFSLLFLLRTAQFLLRDDPPQHLEPSLLLAAASIFLTVETCFGRLSTWGPDELVACVFFLTSGLLLRFAAKHTPGNAALLGAVLGFGYCAKVIFLPLSCIVVACALLPFRKRLPPRTALTLPAFFLLFLVPYAAAISSAMGRPTLGESGALNYAWNVNHLPHWMGWQGGPPRLGTPLHPVHLLRDNPAVFAFGEPFRTTYPPQFNLEYWYDGYRHFFSPANAIHSILINLHALAAAFHENLSFTLALLLSTALLFAATATRTHAVRRLLRAWLLWLPALLGIALYLQVALEARYILGFVAILALLPWLACTPLPRLRTAALTLLLAGTIANLFLHLREPIQLALHRAPVETAPQWRIAHYLTAAGLHPGDRVATVDTLNRIRCTWAFGAGLHIVASIGNDAYSPENQQQDFTLFWRDPGTQSDVLRLFREQGAVAVIVPDTANPPLSPAWQPIPETSAWVLRLQ